MSGIDERIEDYRSRLHPDDREQFDEEYEETFEDLDRDAIYDELDTKCDSEEDHLEIVTAIASTFHHRPIADGYDTGYRFAFTEPLEECNTEMVGEEEVRNGDVLLVKEDGGRAKICIVECKAGRSAGRDWAQKLQDIQDVLEDDEYRERLRQQLGVDEIVHEQYVVCGKLTQIVSMDYNQLDDDLDIPENYAFWGYDLGDQQIVQVHGNVRDGELAGEINDTLDAGKVENPIEFTFGDHTLLKLQALVEKIINRKRHQGESHPVEFTREEFYDAFDDELQIGFDDELREELVDEEVKSLLDAGKETGLFTTESERLNTSRGYRILFKGSSVKAAKRAAEEKYFDHNSEVKHKERAFDEVRSDFQPQQTRLGEWAPEDGEDGSQSEDRLF